MDAVYGVAGHWEGGDSGSDPFDVGAVLIQFRPSVVSGSIPTPIGETTAESNMTTKLTTALRREIEIDGEPFTIVLTPRGLRLTRKRFRAARVTTWRALWEQSQPEEPDETSTT